MSNSIQARMATARAKYAALRPPPVEVSPVAVEEKFYEILNFRLDNGKTHYLIPLRAAHETSVLKATHLAVVIQCGKNLAKTNHQFYLYKLTPDSPSIVRDIIELENPILSIYTRPFIFHVLQDAKDEIKRLIRLELESED